MSTRRFMLFVAIAAFSLQGCIREHFSDETPLRRTISVSAPEALGEWNEGDSVAVFSEGRMSRFTAVSGGAEADFSGGLAGNGEPFLMFPFNSRAKYDDGSVHTEIPITQHALRDGFDHRALICAAKADGGKAVLEQAVALLEFSVCSSDIAYVSLTSATGKGIVGEAVLDMDNTSGGLSASRPTAVLRPVGGGMLAPGEYSFCVAPFADPEGVKLIAVHSDGTAACNEISKDFSIKAGERTYLGPADLNDYEGGIPLVIPLHFRKEELLYENTTSGSAWPFSQERGTASTPQYGSVLNVSDGGYPIAFSGESYYLNSRTGVRMTFKENDGYLEFPAVDGAKVTKITFTSGYANARPYVTDIWGAVIAGGEQLESSCELCRPYVWNLSGAQPGEGVRFVFGHKSVSCMQLDVEYECERVIQPSTVGSVEAADSRNLSFGSIRVVLEGSVDAGNSAAGMVCGFEYHKAVDPSQHGNVVCDGGTFSSAVELEEGVEYEYRSWACNPHSWKVYSRPHRISSSSLSLDFWRLGAANQPFTSEIPQSIAGRAENTWTLAGTEYSLVSNLPSGCSLGLAAGGLELVSGGSGAMTYLKLPSISGKSLKKVVVEGSGSAEGFELSICSEAGTPALEEGTRASMVETLAADGLTELSLPGYGQGRQYCLAFRSDGRYSIRNISLFYCEGGGPSYGEEPDDPSEDYTGGLFNYSGIKALGHPRLFLNESDFSALFSEVNSSSAENAYIRKWHALLMKRADEYMAAALPRYVFDAAEKRIMTQARAAMKQLSFCAYAYRMTGNEKYLQRARTVFGIVCSWPGWNPSHFLDTAELAFGVAVAYDWLYDFLTVEEKTMIHRALVDFAMNCSFEASYHNADGNWNQVCNGGMMASAIALYEKDKDVCARVIEQAVQSNAAMMEQIYSPDGNYGEGYTYWDYGNFYQVAILQMLDNTFGDMAALPQIEGFLKSPYFMLYMSGVRGVFSYSDGGTDAEVSNPAVWWFSAYLKDPSLLFNEVRYLDSGVEPSDTRALPVAMSYIRKNHAGTSPARPSSDLWVGNGAVPVAMVHTGWNFDENDHYLGIKAGSPSGPHGHMDQGSFVYDALGERWSFDKADHNYAAMEVALAEAGASSWELFIKNNLCHSTLSVFPDRSYADRLHPSDFYVKGYATISSVLNSSSEKGVKMDMTGIYDGLLSSATRTVKLVNERDLVVIDELTALEGMSAPVQWRMLTRASVSIDDAGELLLSGGKKMRLSTTASVPVEYNLWPAIRPDSWLKGDWDISMDEYRIAGFSATVPAGASVTFTTVLTPGE